MNKRFILLCLVFSTLFQVPVTAQYIGHMNKMDLTVKSILPPLNPIPDSLKSYQLLVDIAVPPSYSSIDELKVKNAFQLPSFTLKSNDADMRLFVSVQNIKPAQPVARTIREEKDKKEYYYYWTEESITPIIKTTLISRSGDTLFNVNQGLTLTYATARAKNEAEANALFSTRLQDPNYEKTITDAYFKSIQAIASDLKKDIDWEDENTSFYFLGQHKYITLSYLTTIFNAFKRLNHTNQAAIKAELADQIELMEKIAAQPYTKEELHAHHACLLSLINIHRMLNNIERASYYNQILIKEDFWECKYITAQLARQKERTTRYLSYRKTGTDPFSIRREKQARSVHSLKKTARSEGYIVLTNNEIIRGEILDLIPNFNQFIIKIKYEKTLNDPIEHKEYPLSDVKEIHTEHTVWAVVPSTNFFYACEVIAQTPHLTLVESLPSVLTINRPYAQFIKRGEESWVSAVWENERQNGFSSTLKDCPDIVQRVNYGYYTINQTQDAIADYDKLCGESLDKDSLFTAKIKRSSTNSKKMGRTPGFSFGFSTGSNNFVSYFGVSTSFRIVNKLYGRAGAGIGEWGPKFAAGLRYDMRKDMRYRSGWSYSVGYAYNPGKQKTITFDNATTSVPKSDSVQIRPLAARTVFASLIFAQYSSNRVSTHVELGYSYPLDKQPWDIISGNIDGPRFRRNTRFKQPGGIIFAVGLNFGF